MTLVIESFNAFSRDNKHVHTIDDGFHSAASNFVVQDTAVDNDRYPALFRLSNEFL